MSAQLTRQWSILRVLHDSSSGVSIKELADRFEVSKHTIDRDLDDLLRAGFAVRVEKTGQKQLFSLANGMRRLVELKPTALELLALYACRGQLAPLSGTPLYGDLMSLLNKIQGLAHESRLLKAVSSVFMQPGKRLKDYREHDQIIDDLVDAILARRICIAEYRSARAEHTKTRRIKPLRLFFHGGGMYLYALLTDKDDALSTLAVERMMSLSQTRETFTPPKIDLEERLRRSFGLFEDEGADVEILFSREVGVFVRSRCWHPDQQIDVLDDGRLRFRAHMQGKPEIITWVLGWGAHAELVEPPDWREEIAAIARGIAERHGSGGPESA